MGKKLPLQPTDPRAIRYIFRDEANRLVERLNRGMEYINTLTPGTTERVEAERLWVKLLRAYEHLEDRVKELTDEIEGAVPGATGGDAGLHQEPQPEVQPNPA